MPTPVIPIDMIKGHRTTAEKKQREKAESALLTGSKISERAEVKKDKSAHKEFLRVIKLLNVIGKNDAIYEPIINRYCTLQSECLQLQKLRNVYSDDLEGLSQDKEKLVEGYGGDDEDNRISLSQYYKMKNNFQKNIVSLDSLLQTKRKMLLDIERESLMTVSSALRSTTKPLKEEKPPENKFMKFQKSG